MKWSLNLSKGHMLSLLERWHTCINYLQRANSVLISTQKRPTSLQFSISVRPTGNPPRIPALREVELCGHGQALFRGDAAQGHIWAFMVVAPHPLRSELPHLVEVAPIILGQPFVANRSVKALHVGILLGLAWLDVFNAYALATGPGQQCGADVL